MALRAIFTRGSKILNKITPGTVTTYGVSPWKDGNIENRRLSYLTRGLAKSRYLYDKGNYKDALKFLEKEYWKWIKSKPICKQSNLRDHYKETGLTSWRCKLFELIASMPETNCILSDWIRGANQVIKNTNMLENVTLQIERNSRICYSELTFDEIFGRSGEYLNTDECYMGTIHSAKGETFKSVMVVLKNNDGNRRNYANTLDLNIRDYEELRIIYVAITRPRKILVIAVPNESLVSWKTKFKL